MSGEALTSQVSYCNHQLQQLPLITQREYNDTRDGDSFIWAGKGGKLAQFGRDECLPIKHCHYLGLSIRAIVDKRIPLGCGNCRPLAYKQIMCDNQYLTVEEAWEEVKTLRGLNHPHVIRMVAACIQGNNLGILMYPPAPKDWDLGEYTSSISRALQHQNSLSIDLGERLAKLPQFFVCLSEGLSYLHGLNIKHKDIKPSNIIIDAFGSPLFTDFDISHRYLDAANAITEGVTKMTYDYASPEAAMYKRRTLESDVFSLGAVFLDLSTLITGRTLENFCAFRRNKKDISFHNNLDKLYQWIIELEAIPDNTYPVASFGHHSLQDKHGSTLPDMKTTLQHVRSMLLEAPELRPKATDLPFRFHHVCSFICPDCDQRADKPYKATIQDHPWAGDITYRNEQLNITDAVISPTITNTASPLHIELTREADNSDIDVIRTPGQETSESTPAILNGGIRHSEQFNRRRDRNGSIVEQNAFREKLNSASARNSFLGQPASRLGRSMWYRKQKVLIYDKAQHRLSRMPVAELETIGFKSTPCQGKRSGIGGTRVTITLNDECVAEVKMRHLDCVTFVRCYFGNIRTIHVLDRIPAGT